MSKKLREKAGLIQLPPTLALAPAPAERHETPEPAQKTAPGTMLRFMASQSTAIQEADELREKLKAFEGAAAARTIDPHSVRTSKWANRHEDAFKAPEFFGLKEEIRAAGGNVQPIKVRPIGNRAAGADADGPAYEAVYGHRRLRACQELGIPVLALIEDATDRELFQAMERENRGRQNLSAWEQGAMYRRALDEGLYPSMRKLSEELGVDVSLVSKSVALARLPDAVVAAFPSPLQIQFRWAQPLAEALQKDPDGVIARARGMAGQGLDAQRVFQGLTGIEPTSRSLAAGEEIRVGDRKLANLARDASGRVTIVFEKGVALDPASQERLVRFLKELLAG
jgi:ParB family transcriptional regulator, chromosome partitioning protein